MNTLLPVLRRRIGAVKLELRALWLAARHPGTPWYAKAVILGCVLYALTPADLFPDVLPVLGFIDDLIFVPLALAVAVRFVPREVLEECRERAAK